MLKCRVSETEFREAWAELPSAAAVGRRFGFSKQRAHQIAGKLGLKSHVKGVTHVPYYTRWIQIVRLRDVDPAWLGEDGLRRFSAWCCESGVRRGRAVVSIDRTKPIGPSNAIVVSNREQARLAIKRRKYTAWGESKTLAEWFIDPRCAKMSIHTLRRRLDWMRMDPEEAISFEVHSFYGVE